MGTAGGGVRGRDQRLALLTAVLAGAYQFCPVHDVLPGEVLTGKLLSKLLLGHLGHQEVGLVHQGSKHVGDAPRARQDQPRAGVLHGPGNPVRWAGRASRPSQLQVHPCPGRGPRPPPAAPAYLQGAGVTVDQQTEDGDLDAAGAGAARGPPRCPGEQRAWDPPHGVTTTASDHQLATFSGQAPAKRLFLEKCGLQAAPSPGERMPAPHLTMRCGRFVAI